MKITDSISVVANDATLQANIRSSNSKSASADTQETVSISAAASDRMQIDLESIRKTLENLPDVREDKVNSIREAIQKGTYNPSADDVAEKMIQDSLRMSPSGK